ncbi:MAG: cellulase family glycosylhydrolase [Ruminococcus sp.]|nr:cellulase family glycosylhydrolase [Ruminococcus sp.]
MLRKKLAAFSSAVFGLMAFNSTPINVLAKDSGVMRDMTTMEIVEDMGIGINLGNTFESSGDWIKQWGDGTPNSYETAWGSPTITQAMIQGYADEGFGALRVPVAWSNMMNDDGTYTVNAEYMARVHQVIDWALDTDMYVIVNQHWDGGWMGDLPNDHDNVMKKYTTIWSQICDEFADYGDKLIFESQNEDLGWNDIWNQWSQNGDKNRAYAYCNEVNQAFVDLVRASGGNNAKRHLLISGYFTAIDLTCDPLFEMPDDPAERCAVSVHYYSPSTFAILEEDADWGKSSYTWGSDAEYAQLAKEIDMLVPAFVDKGIPVIIGEFGCPTRNKEPESVRRYLSAVCEEALKRKGICPMLWDTTNLHYNRGTCQLIDRQLHENFVSYIEEYRPERQKAPEKVKGDVNGDSSFNVSDVVLLQRWLLGTPDTVLADWQAADLCNDEKLDVFDLVMMRRLLIEKG